MPPPPRLTVAEVAALAAIVFIWGVNNAAAEAATQVIPPLLTAALRFTLAAVFLAWFVRPPFPNPKSLLVIVLCGGPIHFSLVYLGFSMVEDLSPYAVSLQLWIPFTALFSWLLLKERLSPGALAGLVVAFGGIVYMTADPRTFQDWRGIAVGAVASAAWAIATVVARRTTSVSPLKLQGLIAVVSAPVLWIGAFAFERDPVEAVRSATPLVWATIVWAALISTVIATGLLFWLVQRRPAGRVTPYLLTTPVVSIAIGWGLMGDVLTAQILIGATVTIAGVGLVALAERGLRAGASRS